MAGEGNRGSTSGLKFNLVRHLSSLNRTDAC